MGIEILTEIARIGFLTNSQITDLFFADERNRRGEPRTDLGAQAAADRSLRRLWENRQLDRVRVVLTSRRTGGGYISFVNVLTANGLAQVRQHLEETGKTMEIRAEAGDPQLSLQQLEHAVALYDLYALFQRGARAQGLKLRGWRDDRQLAAMRNAGALKLLNIPDATFVLGRTAADAKAFFLEIDLGTETVSGLSDRRRDWQGKIESYERYFATAFAHDELLHGLPRPIVLTVTTAERRLVNMLEATRQAGGGADYWYAVRDALDPPPLDRRTWDGLSPAERERQAEARSLRRRESLWSPSWRTPADDARPSLSRLLFTEGASEAQP